MNPEVERQFEAAEARRRRLVEAIRAMPDPERPRTPGSFSPLETIAHCAEAEAMYDGLAAKFRARHPSPPAAAMNLFGRWATRRMAANRTLPLPPFLDSHPRVESLDAAAAQWEAARSRLRELLASVPDGRAVVRHPMFGRMGAEEIVRLLDAHTAYHEARALGEDLSGPT